MTNNRQQRSHSSNIVQPVPAAHYDYLYSKSLPTQFFRCLLLPRDALVHSAVLRLHVVRLSVCLSVCDVGGSGSHILSWKSWKLIARTLSPTPSLFVALRPSTY